MSPDFGLARCSPRKHHWRLPGVHGPPRSTCRIGPPARTWPWAYLRGPIGNGLANQRTAFGAPDRMSTPRKAAFHTLGCKLNFAETSTLARALEDAGYARVREEERPDVFVLNTCSVTENADRECRRIVRRFRGINPEAFIAVIGCYAQLKPEEIAAIPGVDLVLGANEKFNLAGHLERMEGRKESHGQVVAGSIKEVRRFIPSFNTSGQAAAGNPAGRRTRTFLKVQDGCDYFCSFCTIPLARGRSRSGTVAETTQQVRAIAATGVKEVVLTGVNTGDFGREHAETFLQLVEALDRVEGIERFRISSIEPNLCSDGVIDFVAASRRFMPHLHMPLQSGSDTILKRMRRRYDTALYADRVAHIKRAMPHACIGADVITGTPGETDEEFMKTHAFLRAVEVDYLHVFTYSERANTTALRMDEAVPMELRRERTRQLRSLSAKLQHNFHISHQGSVRPVLFEYGEAEGPGHAAQLFGYTDNYLRVAMPYDAGLANTIVPVTLGRTGADGHIAGTINPMGSETLRCCAN